MSDKEVVIQGSYTPSGDMEFRVDAQPTKAGRKALQSLLDSLQGVVLTPGQQRILDDMLEAPGAD